MIDIIIPVYNTPISDLKRCLDNILSSSFKDYNVIIIGELEYIEDVKDIESRQNND